MTKEEIKIQIHAYLTDHVFAGKLPPDFNDESSLINSRLINSITVLHLVNHFENLFSIDFEAHEMSAENIDTVNLMAELILKKINASGK